MSQEEKRFVSWTIFTWIVALVIGALGWFGTTVASQNGRIEELRDKQSMTDSAVSGIQTDLLWIKGTLSEINRKLERK